MFDFIINFIKATFITVAMFVIFLIVCLVGFFIIYEVFKFFSTGMIEAEWITNGYVFTAINFLFEGKYSDIIEIISIMLVLGIAGLYVVGQNDPPSGYR